MQEMVNIYVYGKKYSVPGDLTIMTAMEYAGYQLKRGCGCRHGFCGACATIYRIKGGRIFRYRISYEAPKWCKPVFSHSPAPEVPEGQI